MFINPLISAQNNLQQVKQDWNSDFNQTETLVCRKCGTTLDDFLHTGFVGCFECYKTFYPYLKDFAIDVHGRCVHTGKVPSKEATKAAKKREIARLFEQEQKAAQNRDYILANQLKERRERLAEEISWQIQM